MIDKAEKTSRKNTKMDYIKSYANSKIENPSKDFIKKMEARDREWWANAPFIAVAWPIATAVSLYEIPAVIIKHSASAGNISTDVVAGTIIAGIIGFVTCTLYDKIYQNKEVRYNRKTNRIAWNIVMEEPGYRENDVASHEDIAIMKTKKFQKMLQRYRNNASKIIRETTKPEKVKAEPKKLQEESLEFRSSIFKNI